MQNEWMQLGSAIMIFIMVKKSKMPIFGQLTLTGELALDWLKNGDEITAAKIWFCNVSALTEWNVPEWAKEKGIVAMIFPMSEWGNPLFITQKSILEALEYHCAEWEKNGAKCSLIGKVLEGQISCIEFGEMNPTIKFSRPKNAKQFERYTTEIIG